MWMLSSAVRDGPFFVQCNHQIASTASPYLTPATQPTDKLMRDILAGRSRRSGFECICVG